MKNFILVRALGISLIACPLIASAAGISLRAQSPGLAPATNWMPAINSLSAWSKTMQASDLGMGRLSNWAALDNINTSAKTPPVTLRPLVKALESLPARDQAWLQSAISNAPGYSYEKQAPDQPLGHENTQRMIRMLESARADAAPEAEALAQRGMDRHIRNADKSIGNRDKMLRKIEEVSRFISKLSNMALYSDKINVDFWEEASDKLDSLQETWNNKWGGPLPLQKLIVMTPGTTWSGKGSSGDKVVLKATKASTPKAAPAQNYDPRLLSAWRRATWPKPPVGKTMSLTAMESETLNTVLQGYFPKVKVRDLLRDLHAEMLSRGNLNMYRITSLSRLNRNIYELRLSGSHDGQVSSGEAYGPTDFKITVKITNGTVSNDAIKIVQTRPNLHRPAQDERR